MNHFEWDGLMELFGLIAKSPFWVVLLRAAVGVLGCIFIAWFWCAGMNQMKGRKADAAGLTAQQVMSNFAEF